MHYAAHGHAASEVIYERADAEKPFMRLTTFKGEIPVLQDIVISKNYLTEEELKVLNNLVSGTVSHKIAIEKAKNEYRKYQVKTISPVEKAYLETLKEIRNKIDDKVKGE